MPRHAVIIAPVIIFLFGMGCLMLFEPSLAFRTLSPSGKLTPAIKNEIRATYGGFGIAVAALLFWTSRMERWKPALVGGVRLAVGVALVGRALGRFLSWAIDEFTFDTPLPLILFSVELFGAILLLDTVP